MPLIQHVHPWDSQPQEAVELSARAVTAGFTHVWLFNQTPSAYNIGRRVPDLTYPSGHGEIVAGPSGLGLRTSAASNTHATVAGNPFATSVCSYLWIESATTLDVNGSVIAVSRYSDTIAAEIGALQIRIEGNDIIIIRAQEVRVVIASNARLSGGFNVGAISSAGDSGRQAIFSQGALRASVSSPSAPYVHGTSGIGNGATADALRLFGPMPMLAFAPVTIPDEELIHFTAYPWEMFAPRTQYIPTSSGVPMPTLGIPTFVPGSLTSSGFRPRFPVTWA